MVTIRAKIAVIPFIFLIPLLILIPLASHYQPGRSLCAGEEVVRFGSSPIIIDMSPALGLLGLGR